MRSSIFGMAGYLRSRAAASSNQEALDRTERNARRAPSDRIRLIAKADDYGWSHYVNAGVERCITDGIVTCAGLITVSTETLPAHAAPGSPEWSLGGGDGLQEALDFCRNHPQCQFGVHIALDHYKSCCTSLDVPSLVDSRGFLPGYGMVDSHETGIRELLRRRAALEHIEKEERCQIERLRRAGIEPAYIDQHNGVARATAELRAIQEKLGRDYRVCVALTHGEKLCPFSVDAAPLKEKVTGLVHLLKSLTPGLWLLTTHPAWPTDERMRRIPWWANPSGNMAEHAEAGVEAATSPKVKRVIQERGIELIGYRQLREELFGKAAGSSGSKP